MCTSNSFPGSLMPYGLKLQAPVPTLGAPYPGMLPPGAALELQRSQAAHLYDYSNRIRLGLHYAAAAAGQPMGFNPYQGGPHDPLALMYAKHCDPRIRFLHEEPKPSHSYIGLIGMGILSSKEKKMVLSDIYQYILDNYPYFRTRGPGWRNSIRHNLSLNDCFIKSGRSANGKGHYWAIHPANVSDFEKGDFRRRRAQRKVRKAMGLAVPDDEDSPSPPPQTEGQGHLHWASRVLGEAGEEDPRERSLGTHSGPEEPSQSPSLDEKDVTNLSFSPKAGINTSSPRTDILQGKRPFESSPVDNDGAPPSKRRLFDVDSLLAPDRDRSRDRNHTEKRERDALSYYRELLPAMTGHPHLHSIPHLTPKDMFSRDIHPALLASARFPFVRTPQEQSQLRQEPQDLTKPLQIDTDKVSLSVKTEDSDRDIDPESLSPRPHSVVSSPGSSAALEDTKESSSSSKIDKYEQTQRSTSGDRSPEISSLSDNPISRLALTAGGTWLPMSLVPGARQDRTSAFRTALPPGRAPVWSGIPLMNPAAASLLKLHQVPTQR